MPAGTTYVAISTDRNDRRIYSFPCVGELPDPPGDREWIEEFRAMTAGYWVDTGTDPEEWTTVAVTPVRQRQPALTVKEQMQEHLRISNGVLVHLQENPPTTEGARLLRRHERALNLILRGMLEVFDEAPPASVTGDEDDNATTAVRTSGKSC